MTILLTGATGFVGREVLRQLDGSGHTVRVLARHPERARASLQKLCRSIEVRNGDLLSPDTLRGVADDCQAVIHLVGIISEVGSQTFENIHHRATRNLLTEARRAGVKRWVQMSALGTRPNAASRYHQTKWLAEEAVRSSGLDWTVLRPSVIYGPEDHFVNLFADMVRWSPVVPVIGSGKSLLQPVSVENVARCFVGALAEPRCVGQALDVCGPEPLTYIGMLDEILTAMHKRRIKVHIPLPAARLQAKLLEMLFPLLLRKGAPLSCDQLLMLQEDNTGDARLVTEWFKLDRQTFGEGIRKYL